MNYLPGLDNLGESEEWSMDPPVVALGPGDEPGLCAETGDHEACPRSRRAPEVGPTWIVVCPCGCHTFVDPWDPDGPGPSWRR